MKIALVENLGSDFYSARVRFALHLQNLGFCVTAIIPDDGFVDKIKALDINVIPVSANIRGPGILNKIQYAKDLKTIFSKHQFDIVHTYRLQPNIIGTFIVGQTTESKIINHITGLGTAFNYSSFRFKVMQGFTRFLYRVTDLLFEPVSVFQNQDDINEIGRKKNFCVKGSAVDESRFDECAVSKRKVIAFIKENKISQDDTIKFLFVSRLLKEKGIVELINGFKAACKKNKIELLIVGWFDQNNKSSLSIKELNSLIRGCAQIKFLGRQSDVPEILSICDVAILPTYYREGTPRFLLESMAMGRPIITTNMPGCDQLIKNRRNGILIEPKSVDSIEKALNSCCDLDLQEMGRQSFEIYREEFSERIVYKSLVKIYKKIVEKK